MLNDVCYKNKVVILGSNGFVGSAICKVLRKNNINFLPISRSEINLCENNAEEKLLNILCDGDILVASAAVAPVKNLKMFRENLKITEVICNVSKMIKLDYFLNISSDAIYQDSKKLLNENSHKSPFSLHGAMHLSRLIAFDGIFEKQGTLCPTLIYGPNDPHNGYGPNQFCRLLLKKQNIKLFGYGEEQRDHIYIDDVATLAFLMIKDRVQDNVNAVTGEVISFKDLAEKCIQLTKSKNIITFVPRKGPMPHGGFRAFDTNKLRKYFKNFEFTTIEYGLAQLIKN